MKSVFLPIAILYILGGIGFLFINRGLSPTEKRENWKKYFYYLLIVLVVLISILMDRKIFTAFIILINSVGIIEMMNLRRKADPDNTKQKFLLGSLFVFALVFICFSAFILLPVLIILYTYSIVLVFDGACQITGQLTGKNKIVPGISPNKTWEGFLYGSLITIITSVLLRNLGEFSILYSAIFGLLICLSSFSGDILASVFKREYNAKDFSNILPGQGGVFDRFDSFMTSGALIGIIGIPYLTTSFIDKDIFNYLTITIIFFLIVILGEFLYLCLGIKPEFTRIISHILAGLTSIFFLNRFSSPWYVLAICVQSALFLMATGKMGFLESHHRVNRKTYGSILLFAGILLAYFSSLLTFKISLFVLPLLILAISDPVAALSGLTIKSKNWTNLFTNNKSSKTFIGSGAFFITSFLILFLGLPYYNDYSPTSYFIISLAIGLIVSVIETISSSGYDNLTIPASVVSLLLLSEFFFT